MNSGLLDRIVSILAYYTFGIFSLVWIIFANVTRRPMGDFLTFNLYQAIFLSVVLAVVSLLYSIAINFMSALPFVGSFARAFDIFFNQTPMYFTFTISGALVTLLVTYLALMSLFGIKPYIPLISEIVGLNFGG